jgi:hypothetical protein
MFTESLLFSTSKSHLESVKEGHINYLILENSLPVCNDLLSKKFDKINSILRIRLQIK